MAKIVEQNKIHCVYFEIFNPTLRRPKMGVFHYEQNVFQRGMMLILALAIHTC